MFKRIILSIFILILFKSYSYSEWYLYRPSDLDSLNKPQDTNVLSYDQQDKVFKWRITNNNILGTYSNPITTGGYLTWENLHLDVYASTDNFFSLPPASSYKGKTICIYNVGETDIPIYPSSSESIVYDGVLLLSDQLVTVLYEEDYINYLFFLSDGVNWISKLKEEELIPDVYEPIEPVYFFSDGQPVFITYGYFETHEGYNEMYYISPPEE